MSELYTISQIAEKLDEPTMRIEYIVRRHRLKPVARVGLIRLFNPGQVTVIKDKLFNMRIQKAG